MSVLEVKILKKRERSLIQGQRVPGLISNQVLLSRDKATACLFQTFSSAEALRYATKVAKVLGQEEVRVIHPSKT